MWKQEILNKEMASKYDKSLLKFRDDEEEEENLNLDLKLDVIIERRRLILNQERYELE
jgi:hypothetical protein